MVPGPPDEADELDITPSVLWALADESTRHVLNYLLDSNGSAVPLEDLAEQLSKNHSGTLQSSPRRARIRLHHQSLPQLDELGLLEYDEDARIVRNWAGYRLPDDLKEHLCDLDID